MSVANKRASSKTRNVANGTAYERFNIRMELLSVVLNCLDTNERYYMSNKDVLAHLDKLLVDVKDNEFIAKLMVFTRNTIGLRYISQYLAKYLMVNASGSKYLTNSLAQMFVRPDDITNLMAISDCKQSNAFRRASKYVLENKFNAYQLKKYEGKKLKVKLRDIVKLVRPSSDKHNKKFGEGNDIFKRVIEGRLPNITTAQTKNSSGTRYTLEDITKLGYMAVLKNLVNIMKRTKYEGKGNNDILVKTLCKIIEDKNRLTKSKVLPFRIVSAINMITKMYGNKEISETYRDRLTESLVKALTVSSDNFYLPGKTALLLDVSSSMSGRPYEYGKSIVASLLENDNIVVYHWSNSCKKIEGIDTLKYLSKYYDCSGGGTYVEEPLKLMIENSVNVDNIIILTDMQLYSSNNDTLQKYLNEYRSKVNKGVNTIFWNLNSYGKGTPISFTESRVFEVNSASEFMLTILGYLIEDKEYLIKLINKVDLSTKSYVGVTNED